MRSLSALFKICYRIISLFFLSKTKFREDVSNHCSLSWQKQIMQFSLFCPVVVTCLDLR